MRGLTDEEAALLRACAGSEDGGVLTERDYSLLVRLEREGRIARLPHEEDEDAFWATTTAAGLLALRCHDALKRRVG